MMATSDNYESSAKIADIVDDCLWYTFECLSFKEKFGVMRVCKRWRKVTAEMIENGNCLELEMVPKLTSGNSYRRPDYSDEESVKRNLEAIFGKQAEMLVNYKLENIENVIIRAYRHTPNSHNQPLTLDDIGWLFKRLPRLKSLSMTGTTTPNLGVSCHQIGSPLSVLATRLKSLRLDSFTDDLWLSSLFDRENVLEKLCLKRGFYQCSQRAKLLLLKRVRLDVGTLQGFSNLIGNSHNLTDIRIKLFCSPYHGMILNVLLYFARFTQLKTLKFGFVKGMDHLWVLFLKIIQF